MHTCIHTYIHTIFIYIYAMFETWGPCQIFCKGTIWRRFSFEIPVAVEYCLALTALMMILCSRCSGRYQIWIIYIYGYVLLAAEKQTKEFGEIKISEHNREMIWRPTTGFFPQGASVGNQTWSWCTLSGERDLLRDGFNVSKAYRCTGYCI